MRDRVPLLGLAMIVKDEEGGIAATLRSLKPYVDRWVIHDTGSTDGTEAIIERELEGRQGTILRGPFVDFSTSRNAALAYFERTFPECPYVIMPDADDVLHGGEQLRAYLKKLPPDHPDGAHLIRMHRSEILDYYLPLVLRTADKLRYKGRVHEHLNAKTVSMIPQPTKLTHNYRAFSNEQRKARWVRDKELLQQDVVEDPNNARAWFYLAQTCECMGDNKTAIEWYERHISVGSFSDEVYESMYRIADLKNKTGHARADVHQAFLRAFNHDPRRAEALYALALDHGMRDEHGLAFLYALHAASLPLPATIMFMDREVYEHKAADLVATHAFYVHGKTKNAATRAMGRYFALHCARARPAEERYRNHVAFYAPSATEHFGAELQQIGYFPTLPYHASNPSVHYDDQSKQWRCVLRTVNYKIDGGKYLTPVPGGGYAEVGPDNVINTNNVMLELAPDLKVTRAVPMEDLTVRATVSPKDFPVRGYEDLRFYIVADADGTRHMRASATVCDWAGAPGGVGQRELVELDIDWPIGEGDYAITEARRLPLPPACKNDHQKNWMPLVATGGAGEPPTWIFAVCPNERGQVTPSSAHRTVYPYVAGDNNDLCESARSIGRLRGGSQALYVAGKPEHTGYLCLMHDVVWSGGGHRMYLHRFVLIDPTLHHVKSMSPHFYFRKLGIEFCAGLALGPDAQGGLQLVASFSVDDATAHFATFNVHAVLTALESNFFV